MYNNINGGSRQRRVLSSMDFYRHVPKDLTEATALGAVMSACAMLVMGILFLSETIAFSSTNIVTSITVDENAEPQIRLNFNITLMDLHCDYVSVDVWDALGTNRQNVTKNVDKWQLDASGKRRIFSGRNREARELRYEEHDMTLEEMHEAEGVHALSLTKDNFGQFVEENEMAFIDMYAPWYVSTACSCTKIDLVFSLIATPQVCVVPETSSYLGKICTGSEKGGHARWGGKD